MPLMAICSQSSQRELLKCQWDVVTSSYKTCPWLPIAFIIKPELPAGIPHILGALTSAYIFKFLTPALLIALAMVALPFFKYIDTLLF